MRLKKLGKMCADAGELRVITLTNADGEYLGQMAGTDQAIYTLDGVPTMTAAQMANIFDWTEKKKEEIFVKEMSQIKGLNLEDNCREDEPLEPSRIGLQAWGCDIMPMRAKSGMVLADEALLAPIDDEWGKVELYKRGDWIAIKRGMVLAGLVWQLTPPADARTAQDLEAVLRLALQEVERG